MPRASALTGLLGSWEASFSDKYVVLYWEYQGSTIECWPSSGNQRPILGAAPSMIWPFIAFPIFGTGGTALILTAIMLGLVVHAFMYTAQPAIMAEAGSAGVRLSTPKLPFEIRRSQRVASRSPPAAVREAPIGKKPLKPSNAGAIS